MNHTVKVKSKRSFFVAGLFILVFYVLWEFLVYVNKTPVYLLPAPSRIFKTLFENPTMYLEASLVTLGEAIVGLVIGVIAGILLASILVLLPGLEDGVMTLAIFIKSTPLVAIAPLLTLWLGFGVLPKIIITALLTFFPVLVNIISGMQRVDPALMDLFRSWNSTRFEIFKFLRAPSAVPYLFTALKITAPLSLIGAVVAEWTGASGG